MSRQRVGLELNKMLRLDTEKALDALEQIAALDLHDAIFPLPPYLPSSAGQDVDVVGSSPQVQPPQRRSLQDATGEEVSVGSWSPDLKQTALRCLREHFRSVHAPRVRVRVRQSTHRLCVCMCVCVHHQAGQRGAEGH